MAYENQRSNMSTAILFVCCYIRRSCSFHCTDRGKSYLLLSKNCVKTPSIFWQIVCFSVACNLNAELKPNMRIFVLNEVYLAVLKIFHDVFNEMIKHFVITLATKIINGLTKNGIFDISWINVRISDFFSRYVIFPLCEEQLWGRVLSKIYSLKKIAVIIFFS